MCWENYLPEVPKACWNELHRLSLLRWKLWRWDCGMMMIRSSVVRRHGGIWPWQLRATTLGMAHTMVCVVEGNTPIGPFRATHKNKWVISFNKYTFVFSTRTVWVMCSLCYIRYPALNNYLIIYLLIHAKRPASPEEVLRKPRIPFAVSHTYRNQDRGGCTVWGVC